MVCNAAGVVLHLHYALCLWQVKIPVTHKRTHLVGQEAKLLQEVLCQLEFVSDRVLLNLGPNLLGLLPHAVLQECDITKYMIKMLLFQTIPLLLVLKTNNN